MYKIVIFWARQDRHVMGEQAEKFFVSSGGVDSSRCTLSPGGVLVGGSCVGDPPAGILKVDHVDRPWSPTLLSNGTSFEGAVYSRVASDTPTTHAGPVMDAKIRGCRVVTGSLDKSVRLWDIRAHARPLAVLFGHSEAVHCVDFSDEYIVSGSVDTSLRVWSVG